MIVSRFRVFPLPVFSSVTLDLSPNKSRVRRLPGALLLSDDLLGAPRNQCLGHVRTAGAPPPKHLTGCFFRAWRHQIFPSPCAPNRGREGSDETIVHPPPMSRTKFVDSIYLVCRLSAWMLKGVTSWRIVPVASHPSHPAIPSMFRISCSGNYRLLRIHHSVHDVTCPDPDLGARSWPGAPTPNVSSLLGFSGSRSLETTFRLVSFRARTDTRLRRDFAKPNRKETLSSSSGFFLLGCQIVIFRLLAVAYTPPTKPIIPLFSRCERVASGGWIGGFDTKTRTERADNDMHVRKCHHPTRSPQFCKEGSPSLHDTLYVCSWRCTGQQPQTRQARRMAVPSVICMYSTYLTYRRNTADGRWDGMG